MIELLISPSVNKFSIETNGTIIDVTQEMQDEVNLYNVFMDALQDEELIIEDPDGDVPEIYSLIVQKVYESGKMIQRNGDDVYEIKDHGFHPVGDKWRIELDLNPEIKHKLLSAFNKFFIDACEKRLGNRIMVDYL